MKAAEERRVTMWKRGFTITLLCALLHQPAWGEEIGEVSTRFKLLGPLHYFHSQEGLDGANPFRYSVFPHRSVFH